MPLWFQTETRVRTHKKMMVAGPAACWTWVCGNCYAKDQMTDGFIPEEMLSSLVPGVSQREIKTHAQRLIAAGLWHATDGGYQIHDYLEYNDSKAEILAKQEEDRKRKRKPKESTFLPDGIPDGSPPEGGGIPFSVSVSGSGSGNSANTEGTAKPHPIRDLLTEHQRLFVAKYGHKPAKYTGKDAKHADDLIGSHGQERATAILRQAFVSRDPFVAKSGHSMGVIVSSSVQNKLIAELSAASRPAASHEKPASIRRIEEMESQRNGR